MASLRLAIGLALAATLAACASSPREAPLPPEVGAPPGLVVISWDGAPDRFVDRLLAEGRLPNLARLVERGVAVEHSVPSFPSKTAASHAALWTGCWGDCNGVLSNDVLRWPADQYNLLERKRGFHSSVLAVEPFWVTAARAGRRVTVLSATQAFPPDRWVASLREAGVEHEVPGDGFRSFSGFEHWIAGTGALGAEDFRPASEAWGEVASAGSLEASVEVGEETFHLLVFDSPDRPGGGLDSMLVRVGGRGAGEGRAEAVLEAGEPDDRDVSRWSRPLPLRAGEKAGNTFFRLFRLSPDGSEILVLQRGVSGLEGAAPAADLAAYRMAYPGFHAEPFSEYLRGDFGPPIPAGGDGMAERIVLDLLAFDSSLLGAAVDFAVERWQPELLMAYTPSTDGAGHTWWPLVDPEAPDYDAAVAERIRPVYARVFELQDAWLGAVLDAVEPGTLVALVSDHGMAPVHRRFYPNRALEAAGLLAWDGDGSRARVDLRRTRALVTPAGNGFVLRVNGVGRRDGIVPDGERKQVVELAATALLAARDPVTGERLVQRVLRADEVPRSGPGRCATCAAVDLYLDPAPGYYPEPWRGRALVVPARQPWGTGEHGFWPERRSMHAIFYVGVTGEPAPGGRRLAAKGSGPSRHIDVAPTLCHLFGIPAPPRSAGRVRLEWSASSGEVEE